MEFQNFLIACSLSLVVSGAAPGQQLDWGPRATSTPAYTIVYTGRLFGYFRYPEEQSTSDAGCPALSETPLPRQVAEFRSTVARIRSQAREAPLAVSMGDDFAPELLARTMRNRQPGTSYFGEMVSKDLFTADTAGVSSDNVACFLRLAGFDAMVPGQQDFYFGPERLRQLARFMAEPAMAEYKPVQMLAANLAIVSTVHNPTPPLPASALPKAVREALTPNSEIEIRLPAAVMPWLTKVEITSKQENIEVYDCAASRDNPNDFKTPSEQANGCLRMKDSGSHKFAFNKPANPSANFVSTYYTLDPGSNHALCVSYLKKISCKPFSVQYPFFQYRPDSPGTTPAPYYTNAKVAVFGIIDPDLAGYVGQFEDTWINKDNRYDTRIQITDPIEAIRQISEACEAGGGCTGKRKVLLAQMPYNKASQLAAKIEGFDIIVIQADPQHSTGEENSSRTLSSHSQPYILAPGLAFDTSRENALGLNIRSADLYLEGDSQGTEKEFLSSKVFDTEIAPLSAGTRPGSQALEAGAAQASAQAGALGSARNYEDLALASMQQFCGSDIAVLQHRDIFTQYQKAIAYWPEKADYGVQQLLEEVLWKGDFAFCLPVKGSTLKRMLAESAEFDRQDRNELSLQTQAGRGLRTLGISTDPVSGGPAIRGEPIDDNKLYGVAMTDYLAFGDTGYPELASEAVLPRVRVTSVGGLNRLAGLACERLPVSATKGSCQSEEIDSSRYFDAIAQKPFDTSPGLGALRAFRIWATHPIEQAAASTFLEKDKHSPEENVENRGYWWFTIQNVSLEYDLSFIRGSDKTIPGNFSGINTFSQLSTPESAQLGLWTRVRGGYSFSRFLDFYASGEERYTRAALREADPSGNGNFAPYELTLVNNTVRAELGLLTKPLSRRIPVRALASENLVTQVSVPFEQFTAAVPCASINCKPGVTTLTTYDLGKNYLVMTRAGARLQNNESWFEAGREYGQNIGIPVGYRIQDPGAPNLYSCALSGNYSLGRCVGADPLFSSASKILPDLENQRLGGWFMDFHAAAPIYRSKLKLTVDSYAELFDKERSDTSFNTRYYEDLTVALNVPLWGNLSFAPQVEAFFFQNKVVAGQPLSTNHYTFVTSSLKLQYGFDWHRGVGIWRAMRFPSGVSTSASPAPPAP